MHFCHTLSFSPRARTGAILSTFLDVCANSTVLLMRMDRWPRPAHVSEYHLPVRTCCGTKREFCQNFHLHTSVVMTRGVPSAWAYIRHQSITPEMRFTAYAYKGQSDNIKNAGLPVIIFLAMSATLLGPLIYFPSRSNTTIGRRSMSQEKARRLSHEIAIDITGPQPTTTTNANLEQDIPKDTVSLSDGNTHLQKTVILVKPEEPVILTSESVATTKPKLVKTLNTRKDRVKEKVNHAKMANVVSLSASAAILMGAFTAKRLAKRRLEVDGGSIFESDSNVGRISDDLAYDTAYTTTSEVSYGSFATPWTGDLEKFDV